MCTSSQLRRYLSSFKIFETDHSPPRDPTRPNRVEQRNMAEPDKTRITTSNESADKDKASHSNDTNSTHTSSPNNRSANYHAIVRRLENVDLRIPTEEGPSSLPREPQQEQRQQEEQQQQAMTRPGGGSNVLPMARWMAESQLDQAWHGVAGFWVGQEGIDAEAADSSTSAPAAAASDGAEEEDDATESLEYLDSSKEEEEEEQEPKTAEPRKQKERKDEQN